MIDRNRPGLLVSVRCSAEAETALAGGADLIDVKEPERGALGRADDEVIAGVLRAVAGRQPVSAALGELREATLCTITDLAFAKWGLSGAGADWPTRLQEAIAQRQQVDAGCRPVAVAYADWERARSPRPAEVAEFACRHHTGLLIDTHTKDGQTLLDWLTVAEVARLVERCRRAEAPIALAGSLGLADIARLAELRPDWFAVRGAACLEGERDREVDEKRVRRLAELLRGHGSLTFPAGQNEG